MFLSIEILYLEVSLIRVEIVFSQGDEVVGPLVLNDEKCDGNKKDTPYEIGVEVHLGSDVWRMVDTVSITKEIIIVE